MTDQTAEIETRADAGGQVDPLDMRETEFGLKFCGFNAATKLWRYTPSTFRATSGQ